MTIRAILGNKGDAVISITGDERVSDVVNLLASKRIGAVPVVNHGSVKGIFSERDLIYALANEGAAVLGRLASDVMTSPAITISPDENIETALGLMTRRRIRHLPVVERGNLVGFVSIGDLVKDRIEAVEHEAQAMRDYIQAA